MIEGFLDLHLPEPKTPEQPAKAKTAQSEVRSDKWSSDSPAFEKHAATRSETKEPSPKPLFTVKPGGIAGYLCTCFFQRVVPRSHRLLNSVAV